MTRSDLLSSAVTFFRDFRAFAGRDGAKAVLLIGAGAGLEGLGLAVLVPVLRGMMEGRPDRLLAILAGFTLLIGVRALVLWRRDMLLARLRVGFVERLQARLVDKLVGASWTALSRMKHARITHLLGSDVTLAGLCAHFLLQSTGAFWLLAIQWGLAFFFSPPLALLSGLLLLGAGAALLPQLAKSQRLGREVADANLHLAHNGAQFLGGLKLAMSQNLQGRFAREFNATLTRLMARQIDFTGRLAGRRRRHPGRALSVRGAGAATDRLRAAVGPHEHADQPIAAGSASIRQFPALLRRGEGVGA